MKKFRLRFLMFRALVVLAFMCLFDTDVAKEVKLFLNEWMETYDDE